MKIKKILAISIIISVLVSMALPIKTEAKTLAQFEAEVQKYTNDLQSKKNQVAANNAEVAKIAQAIKEIGVEIDEIKAEQDRLQKEIEESNEKIKVKGQQSKDIMAYYQVSQGNNSYLEYIFGAETITDMIYRMAIVEQLTDANKKIMEELEQLIEQNKQKTKELAEKNKELDEKTNELKVQQEKIKASNAQIQESMPSVEEQIRAAQENVAYYKKLGCGANEDVLACQYRKEQASGGSSVPSSSGIFRPLLAGRNTGCGIGCYSGHTGIDLHRIGDGTVYPITSGRVQAVYYDSCTSSGWCYFGCNGNALIVSIKHNIGGRYIYSKYVHLSAAYVSTGQIVTSGTPIGYIGSSGCSTGEHLHLEMATCDWVNNGGCTWNQYQNSIINPTSYVALPAVWNNR